MEDKPGQTTKFLILGFAGLIGATVYTDWQKDNLIKDEIAAGKGKQISLRDLGIIDGCHIKHYNVKDNTLVAGKLVKKIDSYYTATCGQTEVETRMKDIGKFKHEEYAITKKPKL